jgi:crotonobetainyl-CoA:carnitine CoA-transferase CaiB-like acyl-CoA transferase
LEQGGDFIFSPVNTISDLVTDPQVLENEYIIEYEHPSHGPTKVAGFPYKFSKTPASIRRHPPQHGEHTEEILLELGYTWEDILELKNLEVIL